MPEPAGVFDGHGGDQEICGGNRGSLSLKREPPPRRLLDDRGIYLKPGESRHVIPKQGVCGFGLGALDNLGDYKPCSDNGVFSQSLAHRSPEGFRAAEAVVFDPHRTVNEESVWLHPLSLGAEVQEVVNGEGQVNSPTVGGDLFTVAPAGHFPKGQLDGLPLCFGPGESLGIRQEIRIDGNGETHVWCTSYAPTSYTMTRRPATHHHNRENAIEDNAWAVVNYSGNR
jgi:hypothetical protein